MCRQGFQITWCALGEHQVGEKIPAWQYTCFKAQDVGFGQCGRVVEGRSSTTLRSCADCVEKKRWADRLKQATSAKSSGHGYTRQYHHMTHTPLANKICKRHDEYPNYVNEEGREMYDFAGDDEDEIHGPYGEWVAEFLWATQNWSHFPAHHMAFPFHYTLGGLMLHAEPITTMAAGLEFSWNKLKAKYMLGLLAKDGPGGTMCRLSTLNFGFVTGGVDSNRWVFGFNSSCALCNEWWRCQDLHTPTSRTTLRLYNASRDDDSGWKFDTPVTDSIVWETEVCKNPNAAPDTTFPKRFDINTRTGDTRLRIL
ncbi:hypothetical protein F4779DRAFT_614009 [Xylariaceae sp. FL0662B]|nr:hypothetical protein F4779DRAFT_614009 [Xylariaceae sp. FL0662B]